MDKVVVVLCLLFCMVSSEGMRPRYIHRISQGKVVGGVDTDITQVPYQVQLEDDGFGFCAGSIISVRYVLSTAYCTRGTNVDFLQVRYGTSMRNEGGSLVKVSDYVTHPDDYPFQFDYDISILHLASDIVFSNSAQPVVFSETMPEAGDRGLVSGWGTLTEGGCRPDVLQSVTVPVIDRKLCNDTIYHGDVSPQMFCAGEAGKDACHGDVGGPLVFGDRLQQGIISWGFGCGEEGMAGVYTNIASFRDFIDENTAGTAVWVESNNGSRN